MVAETFAKLRRGFLLEGRFVTGALDCTLRNHLGGAWAGDLESVRSMKTVCLSGRRGRLWWEVNIVMLLKSMVGGARSSPESRYLGGLGGSVKWA